MEPQEVFCYDKKEDRCNNNKCFGIITVILAIAFSFVVGLLVGAVAISSEIVASFGAIIVLAVVLGLLLILSIILLICNRKKDKKRKCCC
jgi:protein-S-isoprenylcysteine O-methyltransferase Ste14